MEDDEGEQVSEGSPREWEPIPYAHHHHRHHHHHRLHHSSQALHRSLSDSQTHFNFRGWSMVAIRDSRSEVDGDDRSIVFPPINHEGLHISSSSSSSSSLPNQQRGHENGLVPPPPQPPPSDTRPRVGSEVLKWVCFGYELLRSKFSGITSSLRCSAAFRGTNWSFSSSSGAAAVLLAWWLYVAFRRRRRNLRMPNQNRDNLILLLREKDEKINQLLHQIAQMNRVLLALHRDSTSGTGGTGGMTK